MSDKVGYLTLPVQRKPTMTSKALWGIVIGGIVTIFLGMSAFLFNTVWTRTESIPEIKYEVKEIKLMQESQGQDIREVRDTLRGWEASSRGDL